MLATLIEQVCMNEVTADRCIIFCQTYKDTALVFQTLVLELNEHNCLYVRADHLEGSPMHRICDKYDACTDPEVK